MITVRGPFTLTWGVNTIVDVESIDVSYEKTSDDYETVGGNIYEIDGPQKATATLTLLGTDIDILAALLPQNYVANGEVLSTGETVDYEDGAIDLSPAACDESTVYNDLDIESCGDPARVFRIVNARTKLDGVEFDNKVQKVMIKFIGEPAGGEAAVQFFAKGTIAVVS